MSPENKESVVVWLKVILAILLALCVIVPNVGIWNVRTIPEAREVVDGFVTFWSILNFAVESVALTFFIKNVLFKKEEKKKDE